LKRRTYRTPATRIIYCKRGVTETTSAKQIESTEREEPSVRLKELSKFCYNPTINNKNEAREFRLALKILRPTKLPIQVS
jgi:hypothetical protein